MQLVRSIRSNAGDTIVEVMLALSVLGLIIVGGYSIATRSLNGVRVSQERGEALKIAEAQIETVRQRVSAAEGFTEFSTSGYFGQNPTWAVATGNPIAFPPSVEFGFCVGAGGVANRLDFAHSLATDLSQYPNDDCVFQDRYHVHITTDIDRVSPTELILALTYRVAVSWDKIGGGPVETVELQNKFIVN